MNYTLVCKYSAAITVLCYTCPVLWSGGNVGDDNIYFEFSISLIAYRIRYINLIWIVSAHSVWINPSWAFDYFKFPFVLHPIFRDSIALPVIDILIITLIEAESIFDYIFVILPNLVSLSVI